MQKRDPRVDPAGPRGRSGGRGPRGRVGRPRGLAEHRIPRLGEELGALPADRIPIAQARYRERARIATVVPERNSTARKGFEITRPTPVEVYAIG